MKFISIVYNQSKQVIRWSRDNHVGNPPGTHVARQLSTRVPPGGHTTLSNPLLGRCSPLSEYVVRTMAVRRRSCWVTSDSLSQSTFRRLQSKRTGMMASHLPRFLTAVCRMMMILPSPQGHPDKPKSRPTIKGRQNFWHYKGTLT